jgi:hypothetical protein
MSNTDELLVIAFDINGTLTNPLVRDLFKVLDRGKCYLIVWSTLGVEYSKNFCEKHGLEPDEVIDKQAREVEIAVDDLPESISVADLVIGV